jgi:hypothetical protein
VIAGAAAHFGRVFFVKGDDHMVRESLALNTKIIDIIA